MKPEISMFMPCYEEAENLAEVVPAALDLLSRIASRFELIVVLDERSRDNSRELVRSFAQERPEVRLVGQPADDPGYGRALARGFQAAKYPLVFYTDADNQYELSDLETLLPRLSDADLVIGYRAERKDPRPRLWTAALYNRLARAFFGLEARDIDCSFKLIRQKVLKGCDLKCRTGAAEIELLLHARKGGFRMVEVPVRHRFRSAGTTSFEVGKGRLGGLPEPRNVRAVWREILELRKTLVY